MSADRDFDRQTLTAGHWDRIPSSLTRSGMGEIPYLQAKRRFVMPAQAGIHLRARCKVKEYLDTLALAGYKLAAANPAAYLLVAQGNAMLADQLVADLQPFRDRGWDVYIYDYRGYGNSQGKSRLAAIVDDYREIVAHLNAQGYRKRLLYGISMGGVILLDAVGKTDLHTRLVVDSSPARISNLGCPEQYDPVAQLPKNSARVMIISGSRDTVVPPGQMAELLRVAGSRGVRILQDGEFAHPYQDSSPALHRRRQREIAAFLDQE